MKKTVGTIDKKTVLEKSFFVNSINRLTNKIYALAINGFFGRLFTSYSYTETLFETGFFYRSFGENKLLHRIIGRFKLILLKEFENSKIIAFANRNFSIPPRRKSKKYSVVFAVAVTVCLLVCIVANVVQSTVFGYFFGMVLAMSSAAEVMAIMFFPEWGVVTLFVLIPLSLYIPKPSLVLLAVVFITGVSYVINIVRKNQNTVVDITDMTIFAFAAVRLFSGIVSAGGTTAFCQSAVSCGLMYAYFLCVKLIKDKKWLRRVINAFIVASAFTLIVGLIQMFAGSSERGWLDQTEFSQIKVRITSTFENPNNYAAYLLLFIPFMISNVLKKRTISGAVALVLSFLCIVQTWSRGAWLGLIISLVVYFLIYSSETLPYLAAGGIAGTVGISMLAPNISKRFLSIGNFSESSILYRISAWKGVCNILDSYNWIAGIGYGEASFSAVYVKFALSGATAVKHAHSLYLQIILENGIPGILLFGLIIFFFFQNCFEYLGYAREKEGKLITVSGISAVVGFLIMGVTDYVWYNMRVQLAFWLVLAVVTANIRINFAEEDERVGALSVTE